MKPKPDAAFRTKWMSAHPPEWVEHRIQFEPQGRYGQWIRGQNAVVRISDTLFVHAGISPNYAGKPRHEINDGVAEELREFSRMADEGYVRDVQRVLKNFGTRRVVIGHMPTGGKIPRLYGDAVVAIDVGLSDVYGADRMGLVIESDQLFAVTPGGQTRLP